MSDRQPTKHELALVAEVFDGDVVVLLCELLWRGQGRFDPLHDHNDLARLVEAMRKAGWDVSMEGNSQWKAGTEEEKYGPYECLVDQPAVPGDENRILRYGPFLAATFWAIVEALVEQEKRDA